MVCSLVLITFIEKSMALVFRKNDEDISIIEEEH